VSALRHLVDILSRDQVNPPLASGEIVTTGTLTRALPVSAGERWRASMASLTAWFSVQQRVGTVDRIGVECVVLVKEAD
jgi:2-keto-4-pentenoate hydratase